MVKKVKYFHDIGEVSFIKSRAAKRLTLSVRSWRGVRVTMPLYATMRQAEIFVLQNRKWLIERGGSKGEPEVNGAESLEHDSLISSLRKRAKAYLPERLRFLSERHGFSYRRVTVRCSRTRWGSCSSANNINLSLFLITLPQHLSDYVMLHELVHTVHKNHSAEFWRLLDKHTGGKSRQLADEIKGFRITI